MRQRTVEVRGNRSRSWTGGTFRLTLRRTLMVTGSSGAIRVCACARARLGVAHQPDIFDQTWQPRKSSATCGVPDLAATILENLVVALGPLIGLIN